VISSRGFFRCRNLSALAAQAGSSSSCRQCDGKGRETLAALN
jgi:hypothetical protein